MAQFAVVSAIRRDDGRVFVRARNHCERGGRDNGALEGGPDGVRSNVLCPGDTWPGMRHMAPGEEDRPESGDWPIPPIGRIGGARDVAAAAVFYASDEAEFITGTTLLVDGGMTAG